VNPRLDLGNKIWKNVYVATHTYNSYGKYRISFFDPNRVDDITNIPNSVSIPFYIESILTITPGQGGINNSPVLLQPPVDLACTGKPFVHNPNAYDVDGDSLSFSFVTPMRDDGKDVPGFIMPSGFSIDHLTGEIIWNAPMQQGIFNIAVRIDEYRKGVKIGSVIRDMQILVKACNNKPPVIEEIKDTCVEAGVNFDLNFLVKARDPDKGDVVTLTATGGPFLQAVSPAKMTPNPANAADSVQANFSWVIDCSHIRKSPYRVVFRAIDNDDNVPLSDLEHFDIKVVGPAPKNLVTTAFNNEIHLKWEQPACVPNGYFVYRRIDSSFWDHGVCETGIPASAGFQLIDTLIGKDSVQFTDDNRGGGLSPGLVYCYRVTAFFLTKGQFELAEGYASNESCQQLKKDVPVLTHASVRHTGGTNGSVFVAWSRPTELDTLQNPGPYTYKLFRSPGFGISSPVLLQTYTAPLLSGLQNDTSFIDTAINTVSQPNAYQIEFYNEINGQPNLIGKTLVASTVFLSVNRGHYRLELLWNFNVPWENQRYVVYKKNPGTGEWDSIATTTKKNYIDSGLALGSTHCYKVKSIGSYFTKGFPDPIINYSQEICNRPKDTISPCKPTSTALADCDSRKSKVYWLEDTAACGADVVAYNIYYSPLRTNTFKLVGTVPKSGIREFLDDRDTLKKSLAGCYYVTSVDSFGNESRPSGAMCVENCPKYELPNVITPNGDEYNDIFQPMHDFRFIDSIDITIYNRWGQQVFHSEDPQILWDGTDQKSGNKLPAGVYYYHCVITEIYLDGNRTRKLTGTVNILR
jgi:gliding motility-associated-like protein